VEVVVTAVVTAADAPASREVTVNGEVHAVLDVVFASGVLAPTDVAAPGSTIPCCGLESSGLRGGLVGRRRVGEDRMDFAPGWAVITACLRSAVIEQIR